MANSVKLHVITPDRLFYDGDIEIVIVKTMAGEEGFMANHAWVCKLLDVGKLWIQEAGSKDFKVAAISGGFIDIMHDIVIYADSAEWPDEIDKERAMQKQEVDLNWLAENRNNKNVKPGEMERIQKSLFKQKIRMKVAQGGARRGK